MRNPHAHHSRLLASAVALLLLAACGNAESDVALARVRARNEAGARIHVYESLGELLPNVVFGESEATAMPVVRAVLVGRIRSVEQGLGFRVPDGDAPGGIRTSFDDKLALWKTVHLSVDVEKAIGGDATERTIRVGLAIDAGDSDKTIQALEDLGRVVVFLNRGASAVFDYDDGLESLVDDGATLAVVDEEGRLTLPLMDRARQASVLRGARSTDDLERHASEARQFVRLSGPNEAGSQGSRAPGQPCTRCS